MGFSFNIKTDFMGDYITVKTASEISGYNQQYLRRLLRGNILRSKRLGQAWLVDREHFMEYVATAINSADNRYGSRP